jgi:hypothetical protein
MTRVRRNYQQQQTEQTEKEPQIAQIIGRTIEAPRSWMQSIIKGVSLVGVQAMSKLGGYYAANSLISRGVCLSSLLPRFVKDFFHTEDASLVKLRRFIASYVAPGHPHESLGAFIAQTVIMGPVFEETERAVTHIIVKSSLKTPIQTRPSW